MKKRCICLGSVVFLVFGVWVYVAQGAPAYDYAALNTVNGKWLKMTTTVKGVTYSSIGTNADPTGSYSGSLKDQYACVSYSPDSYYAEFIVCLK